MLVTPRKWLGALACGHRLDWCIQRAATGGGAGPLPSTRAQAPSAAVIDFLIFDMDGTLFSTEEANFRAYERAFGEVGVPLTHEAYSAAFGVRFDALVARVAPQLDETQAARVKQLKARYYLDCFSLVRANTPLIGFLRAMRPGRVTALATTSSRNNALALLEHFGCHNDFDHLVFGEDVRRGKPDPECYLTLMHKAGVPASKCLIFEDSEFGLRAAEASGANVMKVVL